MCLQNKETNHHWVISFLQCWMIATKEFGELDNIVIALTHFLPVNGDHIVMDPVTNRRHMIADCTLCDLTFMMRKQKIHTSAMNVKLCTEIFCSHRRAFNMPAGK